MTPRSARARGVLVIFGMAAALAACTTAGPSVGPAGASDASSLPSASGSASAAPSSSASGAPSGGTASGGAASGSAPPASATETDPPPPPPTSSGPQDQTITFAALGDQVFAENLRIALAATASSGLPVQLVLIDNNGCSLDGSTVVVDSQGTCAIEARQPGNDRFRPAEPVRRSFSIESARGIFSWNQALGDRELDDTEFEIRADIELGLSISFRSSTGDVCDANVTENEPDHTTAVVLLFETGTCTLVAEQNESQNYFAGDPIAKTFEVLPDSSQAP